MLYQQWPSVFLLNDPSIKTDVEVATLVTELPLFGTVIKIRTLEDCDTL